MQSSFSVFQLFCFFFAISRYSPMLYLTSGWHKQVVKKTDNLQVSGEGENGKLQWKTCHDKSNLHGQSVMTSSRMKTNWMNDFRYYFQFHLFSSRSSLSSAPRAIYLYFRCWHLAGSNSICGHLQRKPPVEATRSPALDALFWPSPGGRGFQYLNCIIATSIPPMYLA